MKVSELIKKLQDDLEMLGDVDVVYQCECFDCDCFEFPDGGMYDIGGTGWFGSASENEESKLMLICAECKYNADLDHIHGKYGW